MKKIEIAARAKARKEDREGAKAFTKEFTSLGHVSDFILQCVTSEDKTFAPYYEKVCSIVEIGIPENMPETFKGMEVSSLMGIMKSGIIPDGSSYNMKAVSLFLRKCYMKGVSKLFPFVSEDGSLLESKLKGSFVDSKGEIHHVYIAAPVSVWSPLKAYFLPLQYAGILQKKLNTETYYKYESFKDSYQEDEKGYINARMEVYAKAMKDLREDSKKAKEEKLSSIKGNISLTQKKSIPEKSEGAKKGTKGAKKSGSKAKGEKAK